MNFATWAIRQPIPPIVLFVLMTGLGFYGFKQLNIQDMPDMEFPMVTVTGLMPGASPSQLETEVTRRIENAVIGIEGIENVSSTVTEGSTTTMIQFRLEQDIFEALNDVRAAVSTVRGFLPTEMDDPIVNKVNASAMPIRTYTVASTVLDEEALSWFVDNTLNRRLTAIPGLAGVSRIGGVNREVRVEVDPAQLAALQITASDVSRQLRRSQQQMSGGRGEVGAARQSLRTIGLVGSAEELGAIDIVLPGGRHIRLDQIATIRDTVADRGQIALLDGKQVVAFQIQRARGGNAIEVAAEVDRILAELSAADPSLQFALVNDFVMYIEQQYDSSMLMLYEGALLAMLVVWLFLRDWRATVISALALPLSVIPTFAFMYLFDFTLNVVTLLALSLVVGLLVDDTIVEVENIVRHLRMGKTPMQAAQDAAVEIGLAVVATTMTLVAVFLPTAFMGGISGLVFKQFGWTAVVAVLASLVVARLITPMLSARLLKPQPEHKADGALMESYVRFARGALNRPLLTSMLSLVFFVVSVISLMFLPQGFVPQGDQGRTQMSVELAPGTPLDVTLDMAERVRASISDIPEITSVFTTIGASSGGGMSSRGGGPPSIGDMRRASLAITMLPASERDRTQSEIENELRTRLRGIPGIRFNVGFGGSGERAQITLTSEDGKVLQDTADAVMTELRAVPGLGNISSSAALLRPEIIIRPDFARAAELGVSAAAIGETVQVATAGDFTAALSKLNLPERQIDIRVQLPFEARRDLATIEQLRIPGRNGQVPLSAVADVSIGSGPAQIARFDRGRNVQIDVELSGMPLGEAAKHIDSLPTVNNLPPGVRKADFGESQRMKEMFNSFGLAMATGVACVFFVLVLLFKDFLQPVTILAALPLSIGGAVLALVVAREAFSMPATIGLLMLMGIVTKNSILLVEYAVVGMRDRGMGEVDALIDACRKRARPIVMTTLAMAAGMAPVALGIDSDNSFRAPMAIVVIGGLATSTVLSLVVVPVVFLYVLRLERWMRRLLRIPAPFEHHEVEPEAQPSSGGG